MLNLKGGLAGEAPKPRPLKKYVIIAVSGILAVAIILTAILVGMYLFTDAQKDILQVSDMYKYYELLTYLWKQNYICDADFIKFEIKVIIYLMAKVKT